MNIAEKRFREMLGKAIELENNNDEFSAMDIPVDNTNRTFYLLTKEQMRLILSSKTEKVRK